MWSGTPSLWPSGCLTCFCLASWGGTQVLCDGQVTVNEWKEFVCWQWNEIRLWGFLTRGGLARSVACVELKERDSAARALLLLVNGRHEPRRLLQEASPKRARHSLQVLCNRTLVEISCKAMEASKSIYWIEENPSTSWLLADALDHTVVWPWGGWDKGFSIVPPWHGRLTLPKSVGHEQDS